MIGMCVVQFISTPALPKHPAVSSRSTLQRAYRFAFHRPFIIDVPTQKDGLSVLVYLQPGISRRPYP